MGFLSFLSRKSNNEASIENIKAQRYSTAVAAPPPVRGSAPVAGNGPSLLEIYQKQHHKINKAAFGPSGSGALLPDSTRDVDVEELFAEEPIYRPRTAPSRARPRKAPSASRHHGKAKGPPYRLPDKEPSVSGASVISKRTASYAQDSAISIRSDASGTSKRHVDLLDAQSSFKPADFHQRLRATGARDFGEDVAERNLGENSVDIHSVHAQAFYTSASRGAGAAPSPTRISHRVDEQSRAQPNWRLSLASYPRAESPRSRNQSDLCPRVAENNPQQRTSPEDALGRDTIKTPAADRTRSLNSFVALSSLTTAQSELLRQRLSKRELRHASGLQGNRDKAQDEQNVDAESRGMMLFPDESRAISPTEIYAVGAFMENDRLAVAASPNAVASSARGASDKFAGPVRLDSGPRIPTPISARTLPASFPYRSTSDIPQSPRVIRTLSRHDFESFEDHHDPSNANSQVHATPPPRISSHRHSASLVSSCSRSTRGFDIQNSIPERTSSLHHWSLASPSPTVSTYSSNPFRPQSRHTANTSIDIPRSAKAGHQSHHSLASESYHSARHGRTPSASTRMSISSPRRPSHTINMPADYDIDEDISSDDESKTLQNSPDESDLLFRNSGYGARGMELPGISGIGHDALLLPSKQMKISKSARNDSLRVPAYGFDRQSRRWTELDDYSDDDSDEDELSFDIPLSRPGTAQRQFPRLDRYGGCEDAIEEERFSGDFMRRKRAEKWKDDNSDTGSKEDESGDERFDGEGSDSDVEWATPSSGLH